MRLIKEEQILCKNAKQCNTEQCSNVACCVWRPVLHPKDEWESCADCQKTDFGGWPTEEDGLSVKEPPSQTHCIAILENCTNNPCGMADDMANAGFLEDEVDNSEDDDESSTKKKKKAKTKGKKK